MKSFLSKGIICIVLASFLFQPLSALALADPFTVPVADSALGQGGIPADVTNTVAQGIYNTANAANIACEVKEQTLGLTEHATDFALGGLTMIGGSAAEQALLEKKVIDFETSIACRVSALAILKPMTALNSFQANNKQLLENKISTAIDILRKKKSDVQAEARIAKKGFWKSLVLSVLLKTTKVLAKKMANTLTSTYKIKDFQRYADVVGSQVYATQLIQNTATDKNEQLIMRSLINNPLAQSQVSPAIRQRADQSLGLDLPNYDVKNTSYYADMASVGAGPNNAFTLNVIKADKAAGIAGKGRSDADKELQQSVGLKAPRTCKGDIAQQKDIDTNYNYAEKKYNDRLSLYMILKNTKDTASGLSDQQVQQLNSDLAKAKADLDKAGSELDKLPQSFDAPVLTICESIVSPATEIDKGISGAFGFFDKNMSDYNNENLPFFVNFASGLISDISSSLIFGGSTDKVIMQETGVLSTGIGQAIGQAGSGTNLSGGVVFESEKSSNFADAYTLTWDAQGVEKASYVAIIGTGVSGGNRLPLSGSMEIRTTTSGSYTLQAFDSSNKRLALTTLVLEVANQTAMGNGPQRPAVLGARTTSQPVSIRGPQAEASLRGK